MWGEKISMLIKPVIDKQSYFDLMANALLIYLKGGIYLPLFKILNPTVKKALNDINVLVEALRDGSIYYDDRVKGFKAVKKFKNKVAKELQDMGAKYNARQKCYKISFDKLPSQLLIGIAQSDTQFSERIKLIQAFLVEAEENVDLITESMVFDDQLSTVLNEEGKEIQKTVRKLHVIEPELSPMQQQAMVEQYTNNVRTAIKGWLPGRMQSLRQKIQQLVLDGFRQDAIEKLLLNEYNAAANKAKFWARNETSLVLSEFKKQQYTVMGFTKFIWKTRKDSTVRDEHRELEGKIFSYDNPPVIDKHTGKVGLPGQTYNCRCVAIPVV